MTKAKILGVVIFRHVGEEEEEKRMGNNGGHVMRTINLSSLVANAWAQTDQAT